MGNLGPHKNMLFRPCLCISKDFDAKEWDTGSKMSDHIIFILLYPLLCTNWSKIAFKHHSYPIKPSVFLLQSVTCPLPLTKRKTQQNQIIMSSYLVFALFLVSAVVAIPSHNTKVEYDGDGNVICSYSKMISNPQCGRNGKEYVNNAALRCHNMRMNANVVSAYLVVWKITAKIFKLDEKNKAYFFVNLHYFLPKNSNPCALAAAWTASVRSAAPPRLCARDAPDPRVSVRTLTSTTSVMSALITKNKTN